MPNTSPIHRQRLLIVASVLLFHVLALWGLQSGLLQRAAVMVEELVVPVSVITETPAVAPPRPKPPPPAPRTPAAQPVAPTPAAPAPAATVAQPTAMPQARADAAPSANAATGVLQAPAAAATAQPSPAPVAKVEPTSIEAEYLVEPKREYPRRCYRRGEQGHVVVHVLIGTDGTAEKAEIASSSGYDCLNREALNTALSARYRPVMRGGVAVPAWRDASYKFVLPE